MTTTLVDVKVSPSLVNPLLADWWTSDYREPDTPCFEEKGISVIHQKIADVTGFVASVLAADQIGEHRIALALIMETVTGALLHLKEIERQGSKT